MAVEYFSNSEIESIKSVLEIEHLEIVLRSDWGSKSPHYRESIHGELKKQMARAYPFSDSSISHCQSLGGFVFSMFDADHVLQIGFDIEETSRVRPELVKRISFSEEECQQAPSSAALWVAKESSYKSLKGPKQPLVVSDIEIGDWQSANSQFDTTLAKNAKKFGFNFLKGCVFSKIINNNSYHFCVFIAKP